jgi:anthranilate synthase component I
LVAPTVRSFSAEFEPLRLVAQFPGSYPGLLESSAPMGPSGGGGRFDILPIGSGECLRLDAHRRLSGPHAAGAAGFLRALEDWWLALRMPGDAASLPFTGGWLLFLGYELADEVEPRLRLPPSADPVVALAIRAPAAWIRDRRSGRGWVVAEAGYEHLLERLAQDVRVVQEVRLADAEPPHIEVREEDPGRFLDAVVRALEYIAAGDVYQANLSRCWQGRGGAPIDPAALYRRLRAANPSPFAALMREGDFAVISSSPERLLCVRAGTVSTRPIAGTRPRGASPDRDAALIDTLLSNEKERAEHVMLIDLERNDLGRICAGGSVRVDEYMAVESYAHVHHIVSNVSGLLREGVTPIAAIRALFPGGTITGCPKIRCMEIIAELEGTGRGAYTGAIGYLNRDGSCDLNILIRTISVRGATLTFQAGAGIVADSNPAAELAETRAKAKGMLRALGMPA